MKPLIDSSQSCLQAIKAGWVDNPETVKYKLGQALDLDLERLLLDPLHAMMVVARTIPDGHALKGERRRLKLRGPIAAHNQPMASPTQCDS
jgi:hypothetical protein